MRSAVTWRLMGLLLSCLLAWPCGADTVFVGKPPIERFDINLPVYPQHFAIVRADDGMVYVGSTDGVLIFDGERWSLLRTNGQLARTLMADGNRVYVGGYESYGYIDRDANGQATYVELATARPAGSAVDGFGDIWHVVRTRDGLHFVALYDAFTFDPATGAQRHVSHAGRFGAVGQCGDDTWLQFRGEGFRRWRDGDWQALAHTAALRDLVSLLIPDRPGTCLALGAVTGAFRVSGDGIETLALPEGLPQASIHRGARLPDGSLAFSTAIGEVYVLGADLRSLLGFAVHPGFLTDIAYRDGEVLVAATSAVYRFPWPSAFTTLGSMDPGRPSFNGARESADGIALFSDSDVWRLATDAGATSLRPSGLATTATYDWLPAQRGPALLAESHALVQMNPARQVIDPALYPRVLQADRFRDDRVFVGTEHGLRQVRLDEGWQLQPLAEQRNRQVTSIAQTDQDSVWAGTADQGVWRFDLDQAGNLGGGQRVPLPDAGDGYAFVHQEAGQLIASTGESVHRWDGSAFEADPRFAPLLAMRTRSEALGLEIEPGSGRHWAYTSTELFVDDGEWRRIPFRHPEIGPIIDVDPIAPGTLLIIGSDGVMQYQDAVRPVAQSDARLRMTTARLIDARGSEHPLPLSPGERVVLAPDDLGVRFEFALSGLRRPGSTVYRGRLLPYEPEFSGWSASAGYTYTRLRPGQYALEIEARDELGNVFGAERYGIEFSAKWHERPWVRVTLAAALVLSIVALGWLLYLRRTRVLRRLVEARTHELALANSQLEAMAHHDALTQLPNRRRFDEYLDAVWTTCELQQRPLALLVIDVDHFKAYNDRHGHAAGDALLRSLAQVLRGTLRRSEDLVARYGGEEFVVVMPGADLAAASATAEQLRQAVSRSDLQVTVSVGVASQLPGNGLTRASLFERADKALYEAKQRGRDRVVSR